MHQAHRAYHNTIMKTSSVREVEATALQKAARKLSVIRDNWDEEQAGLEDALAYSRDIWKVFLTGVSSKDCPLPPKLRSDIASLAYRVFLHCNLALNMRKPEMLDAVIIINREVALGLLGKAPTQAELDAVRK